MPEPARSPLTDRRGLATTAGRSAFFAATCALILWAGFGVPLAFVELVPGTPRLIEPLVTIDGVEVTELNGSTAILTISTVQQPPIPAILAVLDPDRELTPYQEVYRSDISRQAHLELERERFSRQFDVAAAVGAQAAGVDTELITEVVVFDVLPGSAGDGLLAAGDVVLSADGERLTAAEQLQHITHVADPGDELVLEILRDGEVREVVAHLEDVTGDGDVRLGVAIETAVDEVRLPFDISLVEEVRIGGPSAGLLFALTVYDLLSEEDLLGRRQIVGTGTLDADGRVGGVGGIEQKMIAASRYGADLVLVPSRQLAEARAAAPRGLDVVGVTTIEEAIAALRRDTT